jgi:glycosyltransferase involved in cell wall biosynthesis
MRVAFIGNLAGGAYMMERAAARLGIETTLFLSRNETGMARPRDAGAQRPPLAIVEYGMTPDRRSWPRRIVRRLQHEMSMLATVPALLHADLIQSFTGSLFLSPVWRLLFGRLRVRPYLAFATGSDLREVAALDPSPVGARMRAFFRKARVTLLLNLDMVAVASRLGLSNARFFPFAVDTGAFRPMPVRRDHCSPDCLLIFLPSHLDWGETDAKPGRNSTKGNDRLLRAFARFVGAGRKGHLILLDRGPDRLAARRLIAELKLASHVTWLAELSRPDLIAHFNMADVVADQFDIGAYGTTALEAMACAKPVLVYVDSACAARCYPELPPVLSVRSEDEILASLFDMEDSARRAALGVKAREWVVRYHDSEAVGRALMSLYREVLGSP